jgi:acid phosphatase family membrane protein YuiD
MSDNEELVAEARKWNDRIGNPIARGVMSSSDVNAAVAAIESAIAALEAAQADLAACEAVIAAIHESDANGIKYGDTDRARLESVFNHLAQSPADALAAVKAGARNAALAEAEGAVLMDSSGYGHGARVTTRAAAAIRALRTTPTEGASD